MATITKNLDGDLSLGNLRAELVTLQPAANDYVTGGYLIQGIGGVTENTGNIGLDKVLFVIPAGDNGTTTGFLLRWNTATSKLQVLESPAVAAAPSTAAPFTEVAAGTNLAAFAFQLLLFGL
jgi:hypothetical protein